MKLKITPKQMKMLLDKVGIPEGKSIITTAQILDKIIPLPK